MSQESPNPDHWEPPRTIDEMWRRLWGDPRIAGDRGAMGDIQASVKRMERTLSTIGFIIGTGVVTLIVDLIVSHTH